MRAQTFSVFAADATTSSNRYSQDSGAADFIHSTTPAAQNLRCHSEEVRSHGSSGERTTKNLLLLFGSPRLAERERRSRAKK
jgi:hypothetical protein